MTEGSFFRPLAVLACGLSMATAGFSQQRLHVHSSVADGRWDMPVATDSISHIDVSADLKQLQLHVSGQTTLPLLLSQVDSLTVETDPIEETKDKYKVFQLFVYTDDGSDITSKDY